MLVAADTRSADSSSTESRMGTPRRCSVVTGLKNQITSVVFDGMERAIAENIDVQ